MPPANETDEYGAAVAHVVKEQKCSTSEIQLLLGIGHNKAARIVEQMEAAGIVSTADPLGRRIVLRSADDESTVEALKAAHADQRARAGKPPMKPDPVDDRRADNSYRVVASELRQFVERVERLDAEKREITEQTKGVMAEAKGRGYNTKVIRKIIGLRKRDAADIAEEDAVTEMYKEALGMA